MSTNQYVQTSAERRTCVLLTATVRPLRGMPGSTHNDPAVRLAEYLDVLKATVTLAAAAGASVVVAENSGTDLAAEVPASAAAGVEFVSVPPSEPAEAPAGKGFAEMGLVAAARLTSGTIRSADVVWKVTGRYHVRNLDVLVKRRPDVDLCINLRRHPAEWADMWVWAATQRGLDALEDRAGELREDVAPVGVAEQKMFQLALNLKKSGLVSVQPRLPLEPRISGIRGWDGRRYDDPRQRFKWAARSVVRRVAPDLWI